MIKHDHLLANGLKHEIKNTLQPKTKVSIHQQVPHLIHHRQEVLQQVPHLIHHRQEVFQQEPHLIHHRQEVFQEEEGSVGRLPRASDLDFNAAVRFLKAEHGLKRTTAKFGASTPLIQVAVILGILLPGPA